MHLSDYDAQARKNYSDNTGPEQQQELRFPRVVITPPPPTPRSPASGEEYPEMDSSRDCVGMPSMLSPEDHGFLLLISKRKAKQGHSV